MTKINLRKLIKQGLYLVTIVAVSMAAWVNITNESENEVGTDKRNNNKASAHDSYVNILNAEEPDFSSVWSGDDDGGDSGDDS